MSWQHAGSAVRGLVLALCLWLVALDEALQTTVAAEAIEANNGAANQSSYSLLLAPDSSDYSCQSLRAYQERLVAHYGGDREMPLDVKAAYFEWELWRYHITPYHQFYNRAVLPDRPDPPPQAFPSRDSSTWNGALLAQLSFQYAATKDRRLLPLAAVVIEGLHLFFEVTGQPGLMARTVARADGIVLYDLKPNLYTAADGTQYYHQDDPAKGGFNQIACGYAAMMIHMYSDLPPEIQKLARDDIAAMVLHVIEHDYQATDRSGKRTTYGDMRPLVGSMSLPFNAQVAYLIVALGYSFPPDNPAQRERIFAEFRRLRGKHHVYYEPPWATLVPPQKIGGSPLVKGMNDRFHVVTAAYFGLQLEFDHARRSGEPVNDKFVHQLGQTMYWAMDYLHDQHNSLCSFLWAGLVSDQHVFQTIVDRKPNTARGQIDQALMEGVEQLRRFKLDRWVRTGQVVDSGRAQWIDTHAPDDFYWKCNPHLVFEPTGPATNVYYSALDYLYAYWVMRYYRLDQHPAIVQLNLQVLQTTPGLGASPSN